MGQNDPWGEYSAERIEAALRSRVVGYELFAFAITVPRLQTVNDDPYLAASVLDACLVHARCCTEFFVGRLNNKQRRHWNQNDVRPSNFINEWRPEPSWAVTLLDTQLPLLDKHVAHVSINRADLFGHRWDIESLDRAINAVAVTFLSRLAEHAPDRFAELKPWYDYATQMRVSFTSDDARPHFTLRRVRSALDEAMVTPHGIPLGAWAAWFQRYMQEKNISWPE